VLGGWHTAFSAPGLADDVLLALNPRARNHAQKDACHSENTPQELISGGNEARRHKYHALSRPKPKARMQGISTGGLTLQTRSSCS